MRLNFLSVRTGVVQQILEMFTIPFVLRLNRLCAMNVREAENSDRVILGRALVAPDGRYVVLTRSGAQCPVEVGDDSQRNCHKLPVDELFLSVAQVAGCEALSLGFPPVPRARDLRLGAL
jgi:two-component system chemotaxis response regulator CheB